MRQGDPPCCFSQRKLTEIELSIFQYKSYVKLLRGHRAPRGKVNTIGLHDNNKRIMMQPPRPPRDDDSVSLAAANSNAGDSFTTMSTSSHHPHLRPILVGYAFGPKKMSTMGLIMAEASRAKLSTVVTAEVPFGILSSATDVFSFDDCSSSTSPSSLPRARRHLPSFSACQEDPVEAFAILFGTFDRHALPSPRMIP